MSRARSRARQRALQALYQWELSGNEPLSIIEDFMAEQEMGKVDVDYFRELVLEIPVQAGELDALSAEFRDRPMEQIDPVERAILRIGAYELQQRVEIPYRVVINESVELAKTYGAEQGFMYINSILDKLAQKLRSLEVQAGRSR